MGFTDEFEDEDNDSGEYGDWTSGFNTSADDDVASGNDDEWDSVGENADSIFESSSSDSGQQQDNNSGFGQSSNDKGSKLKYAIIAIIFVTIVIAILAVIRRKANSNKKEVVQIQQTQEQIIGSIADNKEEPQVIQQIPQTYIQSTDDWVEFMGGESFAFSDKIKSSFTVTDIKFYAKVANDYSDKQIKVTLTGSISGLVGTYTLDIPYDKCLGIQIGTTFDCYYKIAQKEDSSYKVVTSIDYE